jgi:hypothetical protein
MKNQAACMDKWWWLNRLDIRWSREEVFARSQLAGVAGVVFVLLEIPQFVFLPTRWNTIPVTLIAVIPTVFASVFAARPICTELWPDLIKAGDEKAAERLANKKSAE